MKIGSKLNASMTHCTSTSSTARKAAMGCPSSGLSRRLFLKETALIAAALPLAIPKRLRGATQESVVVETSYGRLRGAREPGLCTFRGIPYGGDVTGANRFKKAPPPQAWSGVRDAMRLGSPSPQVSGGLGIAIGDNRMGLNEPEAQENCLYLNVWTPAADNKRRAVMFYNHGGGFTTGSGGAWYQDGANLARRQDVVVVTTNHRLGVLGYLWLGDLGGQEYATSGNQGLEDIAMALEWVHQNIAVFGGDPGNVMVFGESGGGAKTSCIYAMPEAKDYFNKASVESGSMLRIADRDDATATARAFLELLNVSPGNLSALSDVPLEALLAAQGKLGAGIPGAGSAGPGASRGRSFGPVLDGVVFPDHPFDPLPPEFSKNKPLMVGTNKDEATFFNIARPELFDLTDATLHRRVAELLGEQAAQTDRLLSVYRADRPGASPTDLYVAIITARMARTNAIDMAQRKFNQGGAPVFMYLFAHESNYLIPGTHYTEKAGHGNEILYKFDDVGAPIAAYHPAGFAGWEVIDGTDPDRSQVARNMSSLWAGYAKTGHPHATGVPQWPAYDLQRRATMRIDAECRVVDDPWSAERKFWQSFDADQRS